MSEETNSYDYIVVGSGAGGGTVAARLAEAGKRVLMLEAGGDPVGLVDPNGKQLQADYQVPAFHALSTENDALKWDFFVDHYSNQARRERDPNYREDWSRETEPPKDPDLGPGGRPGKIVGDGLPRGILYPRAGTLGGCTAHNALITVCPHDVDWDDIATLTGDESWSANNMRQYFERMEDCHHRPLLRWLAKFGYNPSRHGWNGWLQTEVALPLRALAGDRRLIRALIGSAKQAFKNSHQKGKRLKWFLLGRGDPNDWRLVTDNAEGIRLAPLATRKHKRNGTRERLLDVARQHPLQIELDALATRVIFDGNRAVGVEYLKGARLYRAHKNPNSASGERQVAYASVEVILCGGAFNTPQLLMLSGIGPKEELRRHGIEVQVDSPGVGKNLQDRYEIGVVNRINADHWEVLAGARFAVGDPQYKKWLKGKGVYTTNGAILAVIKKSLEARPFPDLFVFALLGLFRGYFPSYSSLFAKHLNCLTWAILKAHTTNTAGFVKLNSGDPRDPPYIHFNYFDEGNDVMGDDLRSVVEGIRFVREMTRPLIEEGLIAKEEIPGAEVQSEEELTQFVKDRAWGHHASCTCPIGPLERNGVVNGDFQVHGAKNLRVVDASVFPRIPGFFIVTSVYMIGEKAADVILRDSH